MIPPEPDPPEPEIPDVTFGSSAVSPDDSLYRAYDWMEINATGKKYQVDVSIDPTSKGTALGVFIIPKDGQSGPIGIGRQSNGVWVYKFDGVEHGIVGDYTVFASHYWDWDESEIVSDDPNVPISTLGSTTEYTWTNEG